jgi:hypothetical protein
MSLASIRRDDFAVHTGSQWRAREHPGVTLRLVEVTPLASSGFLARPRPVMRPPF